MAVVWHTDMFIGTNDVAVQRHHGTGCGDHDVRFEFADRVVRKRRGGR